MKEYAVTLMFDETATKRLTALWHRIAEAGISSYLVGGGIRPHLTLGICDDLDENEFLENVRPFAESQKAFEISLSSIGVFPSEEGAVFFGVTLTEHLMKLHADFSRLFELFAEGLRLYYLPGNWVPHCTMAYGVPPEKIPPTVSILQQTTLPLICRVEQFTLVEDKSRRELCSCPMR